MEHGKVSVRCLKSSEDCITCTKKVDFLCARRISRITFIKYTEKQKIGEPSKSDWESENQSHNVNDPS